MSFGMKIQPQAPVQYGRPVRQPMQRPAPRPMPAQAQGGYGQQPQRTPPIMAPQQGMPNPRPAQPAPAQNTGVVGPQVRPAVMPQQAQPNQQAMNYAAVDEYTRRPDAAGGAYRQY